MKRSLLLAAGTAAGMTAVVSYHATSSTTASGLTTPSTAVASAGTTSRSDRSATSATTPTTSTHTTASRPATTKTSTTSPPPKATTRTAAGEDVNFQYGAVQVKVTERAGKITNVSLVSFNITDPHSQSIDQVAVPQLREQVIAAQSAHIDGVSGASYTSQAYEQSVQSALDKLS